MAKRRASRGSGARRLLVDTMVIIDCHERGFWKAVCNRFEVETVEMCVNECLRGANLEQDRPIEREELLADLSQAPHSVTEVMRAALSQKAPGILLDPGERDLLAYALTLDAATFVLSITNARYR